MSEPKDLRGFLGGVLEARRAVRRREWEVKALRDQYQQNSGRLDSRSRGTSPDRALEDGQIELDRARMELREREEQVEEFLSGLSDSRYRVVLKLRYVEMLRWAQIQKCMEELGLYYSERQIFNLHRRAMEEADALWERNQ